MNMSAYGYGIKSTEVGRGRMPDLLSGMVADQVLHLSRLQSGLPRLQRTGQELLLEVTVNSLTWNASVFAADCT